MSIDLIGPIDLNPPTPKYTLSKFYNKDDELLFASKNINQAVFKRQKWWFETVKIITTHYSSLDDLENAKICAINNENSKYNKRGIID